MINLPASKLRKRLTQAPRNRAVRVTDNRDEFKKIWQRQYAATHATLP
jgi:hypothetical protein